MEWIEASAPSNIALIKYMGKVDTALNKPTNISISYTLEKLRTFVRIRPIQADADIWNPYIKDDLMPIALSEKGEDKFIHFFQELKKEFKLSGYYEIQSANNFPSDCGLASSASSFAALTKCTHDLYIHLNEKRPMPYRAKELAKLSQKGSGSSCRSFFSPWGLWHEHGAEEIQLPYTQLLHMVILCDESVKEVSSSEAHKLVLTSDLFKGRPERAHDRYQKLVTALRTQNWLDAVDICWSEFWDMHTLFHTAHPPFMYMNGLSQSVLAKLLQLWKVNKDSPLITMDAGSNIHLLFRQDQQASYDNYERIFKSACKLWTEKGPVSNEQH